ncbi:hypothetical protein D3C78_1730610 [compost metagenome]
MYIRFYESQRAAIGGPHPLRGPVDHAGGNHRLAGIVEHGQHARDARKFFVTATAKRALIGRLGFP